MESSANCIQPVSSDEQKEPEEFESRIGEEQEIVLCKSYRCTINWYLISRTENEERIAYVSEKVGFLAEGVVYVKEVFLGEQLEDLRDKLTNEIINRGISNPPVQFISIKYRGTMSVPKKELDNIIAYAQAKQNLERARTEIMDKNTTFRLR